MDWSRFGENSGLPNLQEWIARRTDIDLCFAAHPLSKDRPDFVQVMVRRAEKDLVVQNGTTFGDGDPDLYTCLRPIVLGMTWPPVTRGSGVAYTVLFYGYSP